MHGQGSIGVPCRDSWDKLRSSRRLPGLTSGNVAQLIYDAFRNRVIVQLIKEDVETPVSIVQNTFNGRLN